MTEDKNSPESSRLLENVLTNNFSHSKDLHANFVVEKTKNGDICHNHDRTEGGGGAGDGGGGETTLYLEMEATTTTHIPAQPEATDTTTRHDAGIEDAIHDNSGEDMEFKENCFTKTVDRVHTRACTHWRSHKPIVLIVVKLAVLLGYIVYFVFAMQHHFGDEGSVTLLVLTLFAVGVCVMQQVVRRSRVRALLARCVKCWKGSRNGHRLGVVWIWLTRIGAVVFMGVFLIVSVWTQNPENLQSLVGILGFIALLFCFSHNPSKVNWHTVFWAVMQQMVLGVIILRTQWGLTIFEWVGRAVKSFLDFGLAGAKFLFGQEEYKAHKVAIITVSIMVYFNAFIASLFHLGVVQAVINSFGRFLGHCLGTGPIESFAASANVFISMTETPLVLKPYLARMTRAELHAVMTCGFATISGAVLGAYAQYGVPANHLLAASVMSAPAALAASRLLYPETKHSKFQHMDFTEIGDMRRRNLWEAASRGAGHAGGLALAALTSQLAFVSLLALTNGLLQWLGDRVGVEDVTFKWLCSYLFYPLVWAMGTRARDCQTVAALLGIKLFGTPIMAYTELADLRHNRLQLESYMSLTSALMVREGYSSGNSSSIATPVWVWRGNDVVLLDTNATLVGGVIDERSEVIALYMLCGFSTITSIGVCLGVLLHLAEERKEDITSMVVNTLVAGNFASFLTAAVAGLMINGKPLPT